MDTVIPSPSALEAPEIQTIEIFSEEVSEPNLSERATGLSDGEKEDSMDKKKTEGYF